jgi:hypothetical protein
VAGPDGETVVLCVDWVLCRLRLRLVRILILVLVLRSWQVGGGLGICGWLCGLRGLSGCERVVRLMCVLRDLLSDSREELSVRCELLREGV